MKRFLVVLLVLLVAVGFIFAKGSISFGLAPVGADLTKEMVDFLTYESLKNVSNLGLATDLTFKESITKHVWLEGDFIFSTFYEDNKRDAHSYLTFMGGIGGKLNLTGDLNLIGSLDAGSDIILQKDSNDETQTKNSLAFKAKLGLQKQINEKIALDVSCSCIASTIGKERVGGELNNGLSFKVLPAISAEIFF